MRMLLIILFFISSLGAQVTSPSADSGRGSTRGYSESEISIIHNPSFLSLVNNDLFGFGYMKFYNPSYFYSFHIGYAKKVNPNGGAGILWERISLNSDFEFFEYKENHLSLSYGHNIGFFCAGARFKVMNIDSESGGGMGYSLSPSIMFIPLQNIFLSIVSENLLSSKFKWSTMLEEDWERSLYVGVGYKLLIKRLIIVLSADGLINNLKINDYVVSNNYGYNTIKAGLSLEYSVLSLSGGWIKDRVDKYLGGLGVQIIQDVKVGINYIHDFNELGNTTGFFLEYAN